MTEKATPRHLARLGWREWVSLPDLRIDRIKVKIDTGARTSALHAFDVKIVSRGRTEFVRFKVHPVQRDSATTIEAEAPLLERRYVRDSGGKETLRPVIQTNLEVLGDRWPIELTLVARDAMGFRMLLGRQAVRGRFVVDPGRSYFGGRPRVKRKLGQKKKRDKASSETRRRGQRSTSRNERNELL